MLGAFGSVVNGASFHSLSSRFLNAFTVGAETKFTGRAFHKFTTRCVKKCLRRLGRPFSSLKGHCIEFKYYADGIHSGVTPPG